LEHIQFINSAFQEKRRSIQQKFNRAPGNILFNFIHRKHGMDICMALPRNWHVSCINRCYSGMFDLY